MFNRKHFGAIAETLAKIKAKTDVETGNISYETVYKAFWLMCMDNDNSGRFDSKKFNEYINQITPDLPVNPYDDYDDTPVSEKG